MAKKGDKIERPTVVETKTLLEGSPFPSVARLTSLREWASLVLQHSRNEKRKELAYLILNGGKPNNDDE